MHICINLGGGRLITEDPLTFITLSPIVVGLTLLILPQIVPDSASDYIKKISRPLSMGLAIAILGITTMLFLGQIGSIDWLSLIHI